MTGLLSKLERKTGVAIAYLHDQQRQGWQKFLGEVPWAPKPRLDTVARPIGADLGAADAVIVFDPAAFPKKGTKAVGVQRQWCGRLGKVAHCQVAVVLAYVSRPGHALADTRLDLPQDGTQDRGRRQGAGVPKAVKFRTRHQFALEMLDERGEHLPHGGVSGDDELGRASKFRRELRARTARYLLGVPSNTLVGDLDVPPPEYSGRGRRPLSPFLRRDRWCAALAESAWTPIDVRDGEKGPLGVEVVKRRVQARTETGGTGPEELLFVTREHQADGTFQHDDYLSNAEPATPWKERARVTKAAPRVEEGWERAQAEAGLAEYQVRNWVAWPPHQTLSLRAAWFLNQEARRGKNRDPRPEGTATPAVDRGRDRGASQGEFPLIVMPPQHALVASTRASPPGPPSIA